MPFDEEIKTTREVARFGSQFLKTSEKFGSYLARVFGSIPEDVLGLAVGDWLHHKRKENLAKLQTRTASLLDQIDRSRFTEPSPSILLPLVKAAIDESRDELQLIWATLLAATMIDSGALVRRSYIMTLQQMEPVDVLLMSILGWINSNYETIRKQIEPEVDRKFPNELSDSRNEFRKTLFKRVVRKKFHIKKSDDKELVISGFRLVSLECVDKRSVNYNDVGFGAWLTPYGEGLIKACDPKTIIG